MRIHIHRSCALHQYTKKGNERNHVYALQESLRLAESETDLLSSPQATADQFAYQPERQPGGPFPSKHIV